MNILGDPLEALRNELDHRMEPIMTALIEGRCKDWEDYREKVGHLRGLRVARDLTTPADKGVKREGT